MLRLVFTTLAILTFTAATTCQDLPSCDSKVYCQGQLLDTIQLARVFNDSKTFVDQRQLNPPEKTLANFDAFMNSTNNNPTPAQVKKFVSENFADGDELDDWVPTDFPQNPRLPSRVKDETIREFTTNLINIWPQLARIVKDVVFQNEDQYSLIPVKNGFIVPGGRFREFYYWDSYWIVQGLLLSEMPETVKGMLENFLSLVDRYGFVPNGARVYYLNRSQPPLLTMMVKAYIDYTNSTEFLEANIELIDKELQYWLDKKTIDVEKNGVTYTVAHYDSESGSPRPESYREDVETAEFFAADKDKKTLWANLKSGAESGWDFSSRWIVDDRGGNSANISHVKTRKIIPADLNSFLCADFRILSQFYVQINNYEKAIFWSEKASLWEKTIHQVFYDETDGIWYDFNYDLQQPRKYFYPSNFAPLWTESYDPAEAEVLGKRAAAYFRSQGILDYQGGIPTSIFHNGEQWDFPNAWAPLQMIVIFGLERTGDPDAKELAKEFAQRWVQANQKGYTKFNEMFEKYDAVNPGEYGTGGEYTVQSGFGWSNGAALQLIDYYYTS